MEVHRSPSVQLHFWALKIKGLFPNVAIKWKGIVPSRMTMHHTWNEASLSAADKNHTQYHQLVFCRVSEAQRRKKDAKKIVHLNKKAGRLHKAYMPDVVSFFALYLICYFDTGTLPTKSH